ncbi:TPA: hypothetical protein EYP38_05390, partial [Candidatus Micrarchaeota archaeon]|nr:hypothetical protein [Candidatus Micrarchaeota archaeon]
MDSVTTTPPDAHQVTYYTKRDSTNLYIGIDVDDATNPNAIGERIVIHLDPDNSRDTAPQTDDYRLELTYMRGSPGDDEIFWCTGTGSGWSCSAASPAGLAIGRLNRTSGPTGYWVEIQIPFSAIGYTLPPDPELITDMGMAIAVVNDLDLSDASGGWYVSGIPFPESTALHLNNVNDVMDTTAVTTEWDKPNNWGEAFLTGAGQQIYISRSPKSYLSEDIKAGFCNANSFDDVGPRSTTNPKWYKYQSANPCDLALWGKVRRKGPHIADEERRVLFLWAEHGSNPQKWHYVALT